MLLASGVESLLRAGVFGLVLSQYAFGGSILPFTFTYAITYAVFAFGSPLSVAAAGRFSGLQFARINTIVLLVLYALLIGLEWSGLNNMWLIGAIAPTLVFPTIVVYRDLQHSRVRLSQQVETLVNTFVGQGLEGLAPEILAGVVVILFGRPGVLAMAAIGATLAFLIILRNPFTSRAKPEGTGVTLGQMLSDINTGLMLTMQRPRLVNLQLATLGANFFLGVISGLVVPLSLLRGDGRPDVLLWIQGGALISLMIGLRVFQTWKNWLARPSIFFGGFVATGLLSLCVVALVAPVGVWAAAYGLLQFTTLCAILPLFTLNRRAVPRSEITSIVGAADLISFSVSVIGIATAGIVIERMLTPALAPGGLLTPWLTPYIGSGPAAPIAAYWLVGGVSLSFIGLFSWWDYLRRPEGSVPARPLTDTMLMAPDARLAHPAVRIVVGVALALATSLLIALGLGARAGELYTVALAVCAIVYALVSLLLWVGWPKTRPGEIDVAITFGLIGLGLSALVAGRNAGWIAMIALPIAACRLPRLIWLPITGVPVPSYLGSVIRVLGNIGVIVAVVNVLASFGPTFVQDLAIWLTALTVIVGGGVFSGGTFLRYLATHRSALRTQLGLLVGGAALPFVPTIIGAIVLAYIVPELLSAAPGWVTAAMLFAILTPAAYGFVFWNPPGRMVRLERRVAPLVWIGVVATLYVLASLALRGFGAPWAIDMGLAVASMILVVIGLRDWTSPFGRGRVSELERTLLRKPTLEAIDQALSELCEYLSVPGLILAHEQPGRPGWMLRRSLETESLALDETQLPSQPPDDCLIAEEGVPGQGWLAASWIAVAQPVRIDDQPAMGCLLLPRRGRPYTSADIRRAAQVADALATPLQVIALRWAALKPYREREHAQREERTRIARRLHAEVLQSLAPLPGYLSIAAQRSEDASLRDMLARQEQEVIKVDDAIRQVVTAIRPASLNAPLALLMEQALRRAATESPEMQFQSDIQVPREFDLPAEAKWPVHNIVDNALSNARKHAQAKSVWLTLRREGQHLVLVVEDDGVGIPLKDGETDALSLIRNGHFGLADMLDDAEQLNGRLAIGRRMAGGTYVRLWFPVPTA